MRNRIFCLCYFASSCCANSAPRPMLPPQVPGVPGVGFVRENYSKFEYRIPMRDGVKLFTSVYIPKDVVHGRPDVSRSCCSARRYSVAPYGEDKFRANLGPSEFFAREKFIFVYQDARGRYMSEGDYSPIRPYKPVRTARKISTKAATLTTPSTGW